jgi:hypothetical protein
MKLGDQPKIAYRGVDTTATLSLTSGTYDYVVEARFEGCYGTQTGHLLIRAE